MNLLRNFFSTILGSLLILILGFLIIVFSITTVLFDNKFILGTIEKNNTYKIVSTEIIPQVLSYALTQRFQEAAPNQNIANKVTAKLDKTAFEKLTPELQKIVESSYSFIIGEIENFEVRIDLKNYIPALDANLTSAITSLQAEGQLQGINLQEISDSLKEGTNASLYVTGDKIEISGLKEISAAQNESSQEKSTLRQTREVLERVKQTQGLLILAAIILAVLLFTSRIPHWLSGLKWISTTTLSAAFFPLVASFLLLLLKPVGIVSKFLKEQNEVANFSLAVDLISKNLEVILDKIFLTILTFSGILVATAVVLYVIVFFLTRRVSAKAS